MDDIDNFVKIIRNQRHDFMNYLQVIYGYIQINNLEKAKEYIDSLSSKNEIISILYNLGDNFLAICLEKNIDRLWKKNIEVCFDTEIEHIEKSFFKNEYYKNSNLVNNIFDNVENNNEGIVYIYFFEDELGINLLISNKKDLIDEISWMEEWQKLNTNINKLDVYKYIYEDNLAYRIIFS